MRLLFKANINDIHDPRKFYRKGHEYDFDEKRGKELLAALPNLITCVSGKSATSKGGRKNKGDDKPTDKNESGEPTSSSNNDDVSDAENTDDPSASEAPTDIKDNQQADGSDAKK